MEKYQYVANEKFISSMIELLQEDGVWAWPAVQEPYQLTKGKLKPFTKRGEKLLKQIVRKEFYNNNCVSL